MICDRRCKRSIEPRKLNESFADDRKRSFNGKPQHRVHPIIGEALASGKLCCQSRSVLNVEKILPSFKPHTAAPCSAQFLYETMDF